MENRVIPLTLVEIMHMITSGREKLATELMKELKKYELRKVVGE